MGLGGSDVLLGNPGVLVKGSKESDEGFQVCWIPRSLIRRVSSSCAISCVCLEVPARTQSFAGFACFNQSKCVVITALSSLDISVSFACCTLLTSKRARYCLSGDRSRLRAASIGEGEGGCCWSGALACMGSGNREGTESNQIDSKE